MPHFMIVFIPCINLLNLSWIKKKNVLFVLFLFFFEKYWAFNNDWNKGTCHRLLYLVRLTICRALSSRTDLIIQTSFLISWSTVVFSNGYCALMRKKHNSLFWYQIYWSRPEEHLGIMKPIWSIPILYFLCSSEPWGLFVVIAIDQRNILINIFLISPCKNMFWVLIRSASRRHF